MNRRRHVSDAGGALSSAGWLFAELALVLMVIAFGASEMAATPGSAADTPPTQTVPTPSNADPSGPRGLDLRSVTFTLPAATQGDAATARAAFQAELDRNNIGPKIHVGLVILFGVDSNGRPGGGTAESSRLADALNEQRPLPLMGAQIRTYIGTGERGSVGVELFVLTGER